MMRHWLYLACAILFEVAGTTCMKFSKGFTQAIPSFLLFAFYIAAFAALTLALKGIQLSVAYAVWSGIGTMLVTIVGIYIFQEPASTPKLIGVGLVALGVAALNLGSS